jgi:hypothetical protein
MLDAFRYEVLEMLDAFRYEVLEMLDAFRYHFPRGPRLLGVEKQ